MTYLMAKFLKNFIGGVTLVAFLPAALVAPAMALEFPTHHVFIRSASTDQCLHVRGDVENQNGLPVSQWECINQDNVIWDLIRASGGTFMIRSPYSRRCIQVDRGSQDNDAVISQWDCVDQSNVKWFIKPTGKGTYYIQNKYTGRCLHLHGATLGNGVPITQWECIPQTNVQWSIEESQ